MRKLVFGALFIGATGLASGCIFVSDDDGGDGDVFPGSLELAWQLEDATGADLCPIGGDTAELVAVDNLTGDMFTDLVNCTDGVNTIDDLLPGDYTVRVNIVSDDRSIVFATSEDDTATVFEDTITEVPTFNILTEEAFFEFSWTLSEGATPLPCDEIPLGVGCTLGGGECDGLSATAFCDDPDGGGGECRDAGGVAILATLIDSTEVIDTEFACVAGETDGTGRTDPGLLGTYTIDFDVVDDEGASLMSSQTIEGTIDIGNTIVDLGIVDFIF